MQNLKESVRLVLGAIGMAFIAAVDGSADTRILSEEQAALAAELALEAPTTLNFADQPNAMVGTAMSTTPPEDVRLRVVDQLTVVTAVRTLEAHPEKSPGDQFALVELYKYSNGHSVLKIIDVGSSRVIEEIEYDNISPGLADIERLWISQIISESATFRDIIVPSPDDPTINVKIGDIADDPDFHVIPRVAEGLVEESNSERPQRIVNVQLKFGERALRLNGLLVIDLADDSPSVQIIQR